MNENNPDSAELDESKKGGGLRTTLITGGVAVLVAVIGTGGALLKDEFDSKNPGSGPTTVTTTVTVAPSPQPEIPITRAITSPEENAIVPLCADVKGSIGAVPSGKTIVVAVQEDEDTRIYFEQTVHFLGKGQWAAQVNLGDRADPGAAVGHRFSIFAVAMDESLAKYLAGTSTEEGGTWWSNTAWPDGADHGEATRVVRAAAVGRC
ncbi:hypothetical protein GCM10029976_058140 [Kribbella albertanoniae]|uniref:Uncharacterized protein n=1 Tax=Kribbella albertanoniae TaxID=1266829 RepID=A0A4R4Q8C8_9ACTN|nr:hypothetical protein [Kribbella albertanoniae]TDC31546.1 hypothetical protein E1261_10760 [Kribbella albertanoniae]